ncbi:MAG: ABC transporter ATP-binding protein [Intrasporangium sp.]|uniref:ABC transporter ATP-binding protein n=1 Tax=Intrasporangium sp. TaxID=1925024 RepID=UPI0026481D44|nr:ABC transporter ATP-binding protein [Intrasporangium sp.]MDN5794536.1 ABC transporter ATP-binding protein [Intrasporangium sp.]
MTTTKGSPRFLRSAGAQRAASVIEVSGLVKEFGEVTALRGLELSVEPGQVHGFLGPNGAGKTTTIRTLLGLCRRTAGEVRVLGLDPGQSSAEINRRVAYVPGDVHLWPSFTGSQVLDALAGLRGDRDEPAERALVERFGLDPTKRIRTYSKGNRQKVALVAALSAPVEILLLDEPTSGLDPLMERVFGDCVAQAAAKGRTVLLSSHILSEVDHLCSHVTIVKDGRTVESGSLASLRHLSASAVTARGAGDVIDDAAERLGGWGLEVTRSSTSAGTSSIELSVPRDEIPRVLGLLAHEGLADITCATASLEDLFLRHYDVGAS